MKDRKINSSDRQQGDFGKQGQWQQSQQTDRDDRHGKGKLHKQQDSAHRTQQR
jgi:hypothetical protein